MTDRRTCAPVSAQRYLMPRQAMDIKSSSGGAQPSVSQVVQALIALLGPVLLLGLALVGLPGKAPVRYEAVPGDSLALPALLFLLSYFAVLVTLTVLLTRKQRNSAVLVMCVFFGWAVSWGGGTDVVDALNQAHLRDTRQVDAKVISSRFVPGAKKVEHWYVAYFQPLPGSEKGVAGNYRITLQEQKLFLKRPGLHVRLTVATGALGARVVLGKRIYDPAQPAATVEPDRPPNQGDSAQVTKVLLLFFGALTAIIVAMCACTVFVVSRVLTMIKRVWPAKAPCPPQAKT